MVQWWQLIVALVAITIYVIAHIVMAWQQQQQEAVQSDRGAGVGQPVRDAQQQDEQTARTRAEVDQRIEAAIERRRAMEADPQQARVATLPQASTPTIVAVPRYEPPASDDERSLQSVFKSRRKPVPRVTETVPAKPNVPTVAAVSASAPPPAPNAVPTAVQEVLELFRDRKTVAAAVVLREILDRPIGRRRRA